MPYAKPQVKPDDPSINKFFYLCQTPGCGAVINPAFPVAEKNPSPNKKNLGKQNIQTLCVRCNSKKSGFIDVRNPIARRFWTHVRDAINKHLEA
ncbi:MAG TPA: hypothetical protein VKB38_13160 [Terracidiphilus sp.]|nr:hypothetical protein [Terracidiphilus sp.]